MEKNKNTFISAAAVLAGLAALIGLDQWTKHLAVLFLKGKDPVILIPGVLQLQYLENRGAAFGLLQNKQWIFWILTAAFLVVAVIFYIKIPKTKRYVPLITTAVVLVAGAVGNFIDRLANQYVVDFVYFSLIDFPIFNTADIYVTLSVIVLLILIFFYYKEEDFKFIMKKKSGE